MGWIDHQRVKFQCVGIAANAANPTENLARLDRGDGKAVGVGEEGRDFCFCLTFGLGPIYVLDPIFKLSAQECSRRLHAPGPKRERAVVMGLPF